MRSTHSVTIKAFIRSRQTEEAVRAALADTPDLRLELVQESFQHHVAHVATPAAADILLVDIDLDDPAQLLALRQVVHSRAAGGPVIATSAGASVEGLRQLMRLRITEYLPQPLVRHEILAAVDGALKQLRAGEAGGQSSCAVFSFLKPSGGMGATSLAVQTAFELAGRRRQMAQPKVCVVDLDFQFGNAAIYLDLEPRLDILEIMRSPQRLDLQLLQAMTAHHASGVDLLAARNDLIELEMITPDAIRRLLEVVCDVYDYVVIDLPQAWTRWSADVLAGSDIAFVVLQLTVAAVRQGKDLLERLHAKELSDVPVEIILNRFERSFWRPSLRVAEAERALGRKIDHFVGNDFRLVSEALNQGVPLTKIRRRSRIQKQVKAIVTTCLARPARIATHPSSKVVELLTASR